MLSTHRHHTSLGQRLRASDAAIELNWWPWAPRELWNTSIEQTTGDLRTTDGPPITKKTDCEHHMDNLSEIFIVPRGLTGAAREDRTLVADQVGHLNYQNNWPVISRTSLGLTNRFDRFVLNSSSSICRNASYLHKEFSSQAHDLITHKFDHNVRGNSQFEFRLRYLTLYEPVLSQVVQNYYHCSDHAFPCIRPNFNKIWHYKCLS